MELLVTQVVVLVLVDHAEELEDVGVGLDDVLLEDLDQLGQLLLTGVEVVRELLSLHLLSLVRVHVLLDLSLQGYQVNHLGHVVHFVLVGVEPVAKVVDARVFDLEDLSEGLHLIVGQVEGEAGQEIQKVCVVSHHCAGHVEVLQVVRDVEGLGVYGEELVLGDDVGYLLDDRLRVVVLVEALRDPLHLVSRAQRHVLLFRAKTSSLTSVHIQTHVLVRNLVHIEIHVVHSLVEVVLLVVCRRHGLRIGFNIIHAEVGRLPIGRFLSGAVLVLSAHCIPDGASEVSVIDAEFVAVLIETCRDSS